MDNWHSLATIQPASPGNAAIFGPGDGQIEGTWLWHRCLANWPCKQSEIVVADTCHGSGLRMATATSGLCEGLATCRLDQDRLAFSTGETVRHQGGNGL